jgi:uncharacterized CHY-type Zn-finger protein
MNTTTMIATITRQEPTQFVANLRALRTMLRSATRVQFGLHESHRPSARLDAFELERLVVACESGGFRIHSANLYWLRTRLFEMEQVERGNRMMRNARTADENRYDLDEDETGPTVPAGRSTRAKRFVYLKDGRRAMLLDGRRAMPLCGLRIPQDVSYDIVDGLLVAMKFGSIQCRRCFGYHAQPVVKPIEPRHETIHAPTLVCGHCRQSHVQVVYEGAIALAHCLCGWELELGTALDTDTIRQNESVLAHAPVRTIDVDEDSDAMDHPVLSVTGADSDDLLFGEGTPHEETEEMIPDLEIPCLLDGALSEERDDTPESAASDPTESDMMDDEEQALMHLLLRFWETPGLRAFRCALLDRTLTARLTCTGAQSSSVDRMKCIWLIAAVHTFEMSRVREADVTELVDWLVTTSDEGLLTALPEEHQYAPLPNAYAKIRSWMLGCRRSLRRWDFPKAGVRTLAPKFGVSEQAFATACADLMGRYTSRR